MPAMKPLPEFTRTPGAVPGEMAATRDPACPTRNGSACAVVMDSSAFDEAMRFRDELREREVRAKAAVDAGMREVASGAIVDAEEADRLIRAAKGWA